MARYLIAPTAQDRPIAIVECFKFLVSEIQRTGAPPNILIVVDGKENFESYFDFLIAKSDIKKLRTGETVKAGILSIRMTTPREGFYDQPSNILAIYPSQKALNLIDDTKCDNNIVVLAWTDNDVKQWVITWAPKVLQFKDDKPYQIPQQAALFDPVVEVALSELATSVNISNELSGPMDKRDAVETFRLLAKFGYVYDVYAVRSFLLRNGWGSRGVDRACKIAEDIQNGKKLKAGATEWTDAWVDRWRKKVADIQVSQLKPGSLNDGQKNPE